MRGAPRLHHSSRQRIPVRLHMPSRASQQGLIFVVVVTPSHHDVLNLDIVLITDVVRRLIALVQHESIYIREHVKMR